jgi:DNA (cytosine-5)-methyltransferase 1
MMYRNRSYFGKILGRLKELGYLTESRLVNALRYGVPQNRERLLAVAHRGAILQTADVNEAFHCG